MSGNVSKTVAPKREKLKQAMMSLEKKQAALKKAQEALMEVVLKVEALQNQYDTSISTKERLTNESATVAHSSSALPRAGHENKRSKKLASS